MINSVDEVSARALSFPEQKKASSVSFPITLPSSPLRRVFQTSEEMKSEFVKFLQTILYTLDSKKVLTGMEKLLEDPTTTDQQVYEGLLKNIGQMKRRFAPVLQLYSLRVLKQGMAKQAATLLNNSIEKKSLRSYLEIYFRRYLDVFRKITKLPLDKQTVAACDEKTVGFGDRVQAGAIFSRFPYQNTIPLNDPDCKDPSTEPQKTSKPLGDEVTDQSIDLISCLGGLHHIPNERVEPFIDSLHRKLKPGGVILIRDHDVTTEDLKALVSVVHTFVNASNSVPWNAENAEIREFQSMAHWKTLMENRGFTLLSPEALVLKDDPTQNGMVAFAKTPQNPDELHRAMEYLKDSSRPKGSGYATWIEWGNVRFSKQYAEFIQDHHAYAFDYMGHLRQHWQYFVHFFKECRHDGVRLKNLIFSDGFSMNLFILFTTAIQCAAGSISSLPSKALARWKYGARWRELSNLTGLEKYQAQVEKEYSTFIDTTPFYMFGYLNKIPKLWKALFSSQDSWGVKLKNIPSGLAWSLELFAKALISLPVRMIFTSEANKAPDTVTILIKDPDNKLETLIGEYPIKVIYRSNDGHKLLSVPRYKPFTELSKKLNLDFLEIGGQKTTSVDVLLNKEAPTPVIDGARVVYEMPKLQDREGRRYATYSIAVSMLQAFKKAIPTSSGEIEYIHE